jgi:O-acetylserine/cysteine efflux transporter
MLAILVTAVWGCNFIFVSWALQDIPPYLLCAIRFFLTAIPALFFLPKPNIPVQQIVMYGLFTFAIQFGFLFAGLFAGMPPGVTSLIFQCQVFFSLLFAALFLNEIPNPIQIIGAIISFVGLALIGTKYTNSASWIGFVMVLIAAGSMGIGNLLSRKLARVQPLILVAWGNLVSFPLLSLTSLAIEGPDLIIHSLSHLSWKTLGSLLFIAYGSTWLAYGLWNHLLRIYSISMVIPFTLLVPFFGIISGHILFNEPIQNWKIQATWLILGGLIINILGSRFMLRRQQKTDSTAEIIISDKRAASN